MSIIEQWAHIALEWLGFGTLVGLLAKAIMPGKGKVGALTTLMMGIGGTLVGLAVLSYFWKGQEISPLSFSGFGAALLGAFILLFFHRLMQRSIGKDNNEPK